MGLPAVSSDQGVYLAERHDGVAAVSPRGRSHLRRHERRHDGLVLRRPYRLVLAVTVR